MASAGGSIEDNIALFAGGQEIVQNASQVSEAIRGICMRVQGYSEETGQYSESLADLDSKITGLTKTAGNGGGISLGHPVGATGARIVVSLLYELKRRGGRYGVATLCAGGGMGTAVLIEVPKEG